MDIAPQIEPGGVRNNQAFMRQKLEGFDSLEEVAQAIAGYQRTATGGATSMG